MRKNKDVMITLKSVQRHGNDEEQTELITEGTYGKSEKGFVIIYDESEATGFSGSKTVLTTYENACVTMERIGTAPSNLVIEMGKKHHCHYGTPFGDFMVGITTNDIKSDLTAEGGDLYFRYVIDINSSYISEQEIFINIK